jgi:O-antigen ligase
METSQRFPSSIAPVQESVSISRQLVLTNLLDRAIAIIGIIWSTDTLGQTFSVSGLPAIALTAIRYLIPLLILLRLLARWRATIRVLQSDLFLLALNAIVFLSFIWSIDPTRTITGLRGEYVQAVLIALFLATRFTLSQQVRLITVGLSITAVVSFLVGVLIPTIGIHQDIHLGAWRGVYNHKNYFATSIVTLWAVCLAQVLSPQERRPWHIGLLDLCVGLLMLSTSRTGLVLLIAVMGIIVLYRHYRWRGMRTMLTLYLVIVIAALGITVLITAWDQILTGLGRDPTISGRIPIWELLRSDYIPRKPLLGYGRGAFWYSPEVLGRFARELAFLPTHAHNGWYDMLIDVGFVGLGFYLLSAVLAWTRAFKLAYISNNAASIWPLAFLTIAFLNNYTESYMLTRTNFLWMFYMATCWSLKEAIADEMYYQQHQRHVSLGTASPTPE